MNWPDDFINKIICGDCLEVMREMPDECVDITITSPPYNLSDTELIQRGSHGKIIKKKVGYSDSLSQEDYYKWIKRIVIELIRINKFYVFFNFQLIKNNKKAYLQLFGDFKNNIKDIIIWHKYPTQPALQRTCLSSSFEFIICFAKNEFAINRTFEKAYFDNRKKGQYAKNVIHERTQCVQGGYGKHNTTFPVSFVIWFLIKFTQEGDLILDPFLGSGTTARAAKDLKRNFIGIEINPDYCKMAEERLAQGVL